MMSSGIAICFGNANELTFQDDCCSKTRKCGEGQGGCKEDDDTDPDMPVLGPAEPVVRLGTKQKNKASPQTSRVYKKFLWLSLNQANDN